MNRPLSLHLLSFPQASYICFFFFFWRERETENDEEGNNIIKKTNQIPGLTKTKGCCHGKHTQTHTYTRELKYSGVITLLRSVFFFFNLSPSWATKALTFFFVVCCVRRGQGGKKCVSTCIVVLSLSLFEINYTNTHNARRIERKGTKKKGGGERERRINVWTAKEKQEKQCVFEVFFFTVFD